MYNIKQIVLAVTLANQKCEVLYNKSLFFFISICFFYSSNIMGQNIHNKWEVQITNGIQLSGMKPEDFVENNFTYFNNISIEKEITSTFNINGGIIGYHFSTIPDFKTQNYTYINFGLGYKIGKRFKIKGGSGILNNTTYDNATVCLNYSLQYVILKSKYLDFYLTQGAIGGFRIYQTPPFDKDILPNFGLTISIGLNKFNSTNNLSNSF